MVALEWLLGDVLMLLLCVGADCTLFLCVFAPILIWGYIWGYCLGLHFLRVWGYIWGYIFYFLGGGKRVENALCTLVFGYFWGCNDRKMHRKEAFTPYLYSPKVLEL